MKTKPMPIPKGFNPVGFEAKKRGPSAPALGIPTQGMQNVKAGLPRNPMNIGEAMQAPVGGVPNPVAAMQNPVPENRIATFANKDQETT